MTKLEEFDARVANMRETLVGVLAREPDESLITARLDFSIERAARHEATGQPCRECGSMTVPAGSCHVCTECGTSGGCS